MCAKQEMGRIASADWMMESVLSSLSMSARLKPSKSWGATGPLAFGMHQIHRFVTMARLYPDVRAGIFLQSVLGGAAVNCVSAFSS
ncbi:MAG: hypothetical protein JO121_05865 [Deltaproteobacteria bacterium]|nr:hypothetical protein [Deltaproteobacteria bacterium]